MDKPKFDLPNALKTIDTGIEVNNRIIAKCDEIMNIMREKKKNVQAKITSLQQIKRNIIRKANDG